MHFHYAIQGNIRAQIETIFVERNRHLKKEESAGLESLAHRFDQHRDHWRRIVLQDKSRENEIDWRVVIKRPVE